MAGRGSPTLLRAGRRRGRWLGLAGGTSPGLTPASSASPAACPRGRCRRRRAGRGGGRPRPSRGRRGPPRAGATRSSISSSLGPSGAASAPFHASGSRTPRTRSKRGQQVEHALAVAVAERPSSTATLTSRTRTKRAASAPARLRSSARAPAKSCSAVSRAAARRASGSPLSAGVRQAEAHLVDAAQRRRRRVEALEGEVELLAVVDRDQQVAQRPRVDAARQQVLQRVLVAERLGHLLAVDDQVLGVQPVAREGLAGGALALRDLVLVVREDVVDAAAVDVEGLAEVAHAHRRALDVPARPARPPRRLPGRLALLGAPSTARSRARPPCRTRRSPPARPGAAARVDVASLP